MEVSRLNNFGALRLCFALLVILSHSPQLADGTTAREPLSMLAGAHITLGELAVTGFFLVSGYLVAKSYENSASAWQYVLKRVLRIYPGYAVAFLVCVFAIAPLVGGARSSALHTLTDIALLNRPIRPGVFPGTPYPELDGSMWTIVYEFRCYLLILALGIIGVLRRRSIIIALTVAGLIASTLIPETPAWQLGYGMGSAYRNVYFAAVFGLGVLHYLYRDRIRYKGTYTIPAALCAGALLFFPQFSAAGSALFGSYVVFWFALAVSSRRLSQIGAHTDLSYGVYLYAWPIQKLLLWNDPLMSPWLVTGITIPLSMMCAFASWHAVEKPFLRLKRIGFAANRGPRTSSHRPTPASSHHRA